MAFLPGVDAHRGESADQDVLLYQEDDELFWVGIDGSRDGEWLVVQSESKMTAEVRLFATQAPERNFIVSERRSGLHYTVEPAGDCLLIVHNRTNVDFDLALAPIGPSEPETWVPLYEALPGQRLAKSWHSAISLC